MGLLIILVIIVFIFVFISMIFYQKAILEGFSNNTEPWSTDLLRRFNIYQNTVNLNFNQFNLDLLQKQATPEEAEQLLATGYWPWPDDLKNQYLDKVWSNPMVKIDPQYSLDYAMKIYNKNAATELVAWNTKEGHFLLYGGDLGVRRRDGEGQGYGNKIHNTIKCGVDHDGNSVMQKKMYKGMNLWNGTMDSSVTTVKPNDIPKVMPGFSFVKASCDPCVALNTPVDFSCPFKLNVKGDTTVSPVWQTLWGL
jgi:hypothetical protein